ncbi:DsbA family protein [Parahaliea sp. F7430]|uniref:DsbA family protein n=1 Tax=Sediminihaliea albiluteola TaxID=2758564 RepID=A0A7W2TY18_9GAMM|nr:DsbA family protein [Sediminihaliea albiluteola]MBA6414017.1 DsbA family protein [Sediminihaliea albiluteola]
MSTAILYYVHDPMCSWCWGFRRSWDHLCAALPNTVKVVNVVGGLAADSEQAMPLEQQATIAGYWRDVAERTGASFNFDFWRDCQPRRSTYPACRAVLAARRQGAELAMIDAIQRAYYLRAMNPSDNSTLIDLAAELNLDTAQFSNDLSSAEIEQELHNDFALRRQLGVRSFPSLVLVHGNKLNAIDIDYQSHAPMLEAICRTASLESQH